MKIKKAEGKALTDTGEEVQGICSSKSRNIVNVAKVNKRKGTAETGLLVVEGRCVIFCTKAKVEFGQAGCE